MKDLKDTICSLSTAPGRAGIAVVRVSGPECMNIARGSFSPERTIEEFPARRATLGQIRDVRTGAAIDQGILTYFPAPNSYTGEDLAEISLHGSPVLVAGLLESLCSAGARLAEPGEFTLRAFIHGKMDLSQAEAVRDIIEASTLYQAQVASRQRSGQLSAQMEPVKRALIEIIVNLETAVEFVEEDAAPESRQQIAARIEHTVEELTRWIESFRRGRIIREGFVLAIIGRPNVGKSSVFNALLAQERSIVTEIPGTTRDLVSEVTNLAGIPTRLLDTAGVCATDDRIESIGVERSYRAMADADAVVLVIDRSLPCSQGDAELRALLKDGTGIIAFNKSDLPSAWQPGEMTSFSESFPFVEVSAKTGDCIQGLRQAILRHLLGDSGPDRDGILITNIRHCNCLEAANEKLKRASDAFKQGVSEEYVLVDLHAALKELGAVTGGTSTEDILSEIFSRFCIGK